MIDQNTGFNLSNLNNQTLKLEVRSGSTEKLLNLSWFPISFEEKLMVIQVIFTDPYEVSTN